MAWAITPALQKVNGQLSAIMTAVTATDACGVEYLFEEMTGHTGGTSSGWTNSTFYEDFNLEPNTVYEYHVKARDKSYNHTDTDWSPVIRLTTPAAGQDVNDPNAGDKTAPTPDPSQWLVPPHISYTGSFYYHIMTAVTATDASGYVEYYFDRVDGGGTDSGWIKSPTYTAGGFWGVTHSSYRFKTRDRFHNESEWSPTMYTWE
jgi:hypothetical protein